MDKLHKKRNKKDYPHFDKFFVGSPEYAEGYERIFGKKAKNGTKKVNATRRRRKVRKTGKESPL